MTILELPRLARFDTDAWELESGERRQAEHGSFELPSRDEREALIPGDAAKLLFWIEAEDEDGNIEPSCERMWVIVNSFVGGYFRGVLSNQPASIKPGTGSLAHGSQVWFQAEHVIDISHPDFEDAEGAPGKDDPQ